MSLEKDFAGEIFHHALELIEVEKAWTQGFYAKDKNGEDVWGNSPHAVCWCTVGALLNSVEWLKELYPTHVGEVEQSWQYLYREFESFVTTRWPNYGNLAQMNDDLPWNRVMAVWEEFGIKQRYIFDPELPVTE